MARGLFSLSALLAVSACVSFVAGSDAGIPFQGVAQAGGVGVSDTQDISYYVNITLGGQDFTVILDSGSSDLWVYAPNTTLKTTNSSGVSTNITYGKGFVAGEIQFAELKVGEYTVPSQAFINVNYTEDIGDTIGILGIGFDSNFNSEIEEALHGAWGPNVTLGRIPFSNILAQNSSTQAFLDVSLGRSSDVDGVSEGVFLIGAHAPQYAAVAQAPALNTTPGEWSVLVDSISLNGQNFTFNTSVSKGVPQGKAVAVLDTGSSLGSIPEAAVDFIYSNIDGAVNIGGSWYVPCQTSANLTWYIGGQPFPVHPLDLSLVSPATFPISPTFNLTATMCVATYQAADNIGGGLDMILGDSFLRNVYASFNIGADANHTQDGTGSYIQLLSTTNMTEAIPEFEVSRMTVLESALNVVDPYVVAQLIVAYQNSTDSSASPSSANSTNSTAVATASATAAATPLSSASVTSSSSSAPVSSSSSVSAASAAAPSSSSTSTSSSSSATAPSSTTVTSAPEKTEEASGALSRLTTSDSSSTSSDDDTLLPLLDKYGPVVIGLLAGNLFVMLLLCVIASVACMRGVLRSGARTRNNYAPVGAHFKDDA